MSILFKLSEKELSSKWWIFLRFGILPKSMHQIAEIRFENCKIFIATEGAHPPQIPGFQRKICKVLLIIFLSFLPSLPSLFPFFPPFSSFIDWHFLQHIIPTILIKLCQTIFRHQSVWSRPQKALLIAAIFSANSLTVGKGQPSELFTNCWQGAAFRIF